jgi:hypothetical protein
MGRLEVIEKLKTCQERLNTFKELKNDIDNYYFKSAHFDVRLETQQHLNTRQYKGGEIQVQKHLFITYLKNEIESLEERMKILMTELLGVE